MNKTNDNKNLSLADGEQSGAIDRGHKIGSFKVRAHRGVACGKKKGKMFRAFELTESDEALAAKLDYSKAFHAFIRQLRRWCEDLQYQVVVHKQGETSRVTGERRRNWHLLTYGTKKIPVFKVEKLWRRLYLSGVRGMRGVQNIERSINYMVAYVGNDNKFISARSSQGWVFPGWIGWSKWYRRHFSPDGSYPAEKALAWLSLMSPSERDEITLQSLMKGEKRKVPVRRMGRVGWERMMAKQKEREY